ncbi:hypothetical protein P350_15755 [Burkholderia cepacia JBK9]|nr:hypothetical protein P350_15755 [Burkholderia cepacia JBK9]
MSMRDGRIKFFAQRIGEAAHDGGRDIVACLDRWSRDSFRQRGFAVDQSAPGGLEDREVLRLDEVRPATWSRRCSCEQRGKLGRRYIHGRRVTAVHI